MTPSIKGITLELGGKSWVVPPLSLGSLEVLQERLDGYKGQFDKEGTALVIDCLHAALSRNYPGITRETVAELVGLENAHEVMAAISDVSGVARKKREEAAAEGEALALETGAASTRKSSRRRVKPRK